LKTTILIATQILSILQSVHEHHFIHRDIKPENFVIDDDNNVYLIDFGLAFKYRSPKTLEHIAYSENVKFRGTARFASRMAQLDVRQSRRDDLESLGYTLVYLLKGSLPWQNLRDDKKVIKKKIRMPFEILTKGLDPHLVLFFKHIDSLKFDQTPDYALLQDLLYEILRRSLTSSRGLPISPPCAVLTCDRYRQAPVSTRTDLCLPHSKLLCQFEECFRLKASRNSLHCVQHQRSCIECKALESDVCMNANGRGVKCYCEWNLHVAMLKFTCSKCKCTKFVPDDAFFALRCVQCSHATYYDPVVALDCFQTMTDKYPMVLSSAVSARKSTCI
jgi:serine/threonine protein kinase